MKIFKSLNNVVSKLRLPNCGQALPSQNYPINYNAHDYVCLFPKFWESFLRRQLLLLTTLKYNLNFYQFESLSIFNILGWYLINKTEDFCINLLTMWGCTYMLTVWEPSSDWSWAENLFPGPGSAECGDSGAHATGHCMPERWIFSRDLLTTGKNFSSSSWWIGLTASLWCNQIHLKIVDDEVELFLQRNLIIWMTNILYPSSLQTESGWWKCVRKKRWSSLGEL